VLLLPLMIPCHAHAGSLPASTVFYIDPNSQVMQWVNANPNDPRQPVDRPPAYSAARRGATR
jgi:hypothetical protein